MNKKEPVPIQAELLCKATAELDDSVINDLLQTDGNLKELLNDRSCKDKSDNSNGGSVELQ